MTIIGYLQNVLFLSFLSEPMLQYVDKIFFLYVIV